ncbi:MAG: hypothetical protein K6A63_06405 [Acholeplasmatales bacterium]|nr:hypothetical protein [Acholeplasmatales bacterium]
MKGLKKIGLMALSLAFVGAVASCGGSNKTSTAASSQATSSSEATGSISDMYDVEHEITDSPTDTYRLSSISVDYSNATTIFYVGEEFSYEGLAVKKSYIVTHEDGTKENKIITTNEFTVDSDAVDMSAVGTYTVYVQARDGASIKETNYKIEVKSSLFESTAGLTYNAGLQVTYSDNTLIKTSLLEDSSYNYETIINGLNITLQKKTVNATATEVVDEDPITISKSDANLTIESSIDINTVGTYLIKLTYKGEDKTINGKTYSNNVTAFLVYDVTNPIQSITVLATSSATLFEANIDGIDPAANGWKVKVTPTVGAAYTEAYSSDKYELSGVDLFNWGQQQVATITHIESGVSATKIIQINESTTQNIIPYYDLTPTLSDYNGAGNPETVMIGGTDFIYGPLPYKVGDDLYYDSGATYTTGRDTKDLYGSIAFPVRVTIKGTSQAFKISMSTAGQIVVFFASSGDEARDLCFYNEVDGAIGEEIDSTTSSDVKQTITRVTFTADAAGNYYIANPSGGMYIHGFIIATAK